MMPEMDGLTFCKKIRHFVDCPILFLTAKNMERDIVGGLASGGDDYMTKPFGMEELLARVAAHLRREKRERHSSLLLGEIRIDLSSKEVFAYNEKISLTKSEYEISEEIVYDNGVVHDSEGETEELEIAEIEEFQRQLQGIREEALQVTTFNKTQEKMKADFDEKTLELDQNFDKMAVGTVGFADIYDLASIPQRLMLVGRMGVAMRFATTELRYKVDRAHAEIAEYIFKV